jgi:hypothetical protein
VTADCTCGRGPIAKTCKRGETCNAATGVCTAGTPPAVCPAAPTPATAACTCGTGPTSTTCTAGQSCNAATGVCSPGTPPAACPAAPTPATAACTCGKGPTSTTCTAGQSCNAATGVCSGGTPPAACPRAPTPATTDCTCKVGPIDKICKKNEKCTPLGCTFLKNIQADAQERGAGADLCPASANNVAVLITAFVKLDLVPATTPAIISKNPCAKCLGGDIKYVAAEASLLALPLGVIGGVKCPNLCLVDEQGRSWTYSDTSTNATSVFVAVKDSGVPRVFVHLLDRSDKVSPNLGLVASDGTKYLVGDQKDKLANFLTKKSPSVKSISCGVCAHWDETCQKVESRQARDTEHQMAGQGADEEVTTQSPSSTSPVANKEDEVDRILSA